MRVAAIDARRFDHTAAGVPLRLRFQPGRQTKSPLTTHPRQIRPDLQKSAQVLPGWFCPSLTTGGGINGGWVAVRGQCKGHKIDNTLAEPIPGYCSAVRQETKPMYVHVLPGRKQAGPGISRRQTVMASLFFHIARLMPGFICGFHGCGGRSDGYSGFRHKNRIHCPPRNLRESAIWQTRLSLAGSAGTSRTASQTIPGLVLRGGRIRHDVPDEYPRQAVKEA